MLIIILIIINLCNKPVKVKQNKTKQKAENKNRQNE